jgi:hypothetical protein
MSTKAGTWHWNLNLPRRQIWFTSLSFHISRRKQSRGLRQDYRCVCSDRSVISQNKQHWNIYCAWPRAFLFINYGSTLLSCDEYRWRLLYSGIRTWNNVSKVPDHDDRQSWLIADFRRSHLFTEQFLADVWSVLFVLLFVSKAGLSDAELTHLKSIVVNLLTSFEYWGNCLVRTLSKFTLWVNLLITFV